MKFKCTSQKARSDITNEGEGQTHVTHTGVKITDLLDGSVLCSSREA